MSDPATFVEYSERLTRFFGGAWPSFHDAEIISLDLWRGDLAPERDSWIAPVITMKIRLLEATQPGATHAGNDTLVTLRFQDADDIKLLGFNHQNSIDELVFSQETRGEGLLPYLRVTLVPDFGVDASFRCFRAEVLQVEPCSDQST